MTVPKQEMVTGLTGRRFSVEYLYRGDRASAEEIGRVVANEQTVEFPDALVPDGEIRDEVMGRITAIEEVDKELYRLVLSYEEGSAGSDLAQIINILNGLTTFIPGLKAQRLDATKEMLGRFKGPRFGLEGVRELVGVHDRPLLCTALKPMGLSSDSLAKMARECALGGLDIVKDDHGITDLPYAPFEERVSRIAAAVAEANAKSGFKTLYAANITTAADRIVDRALYAQEAGATMLMVAPAIIGFDTMRMLADDPRVNLPIISHPTVSGAFAAGETAPFSFYLYYGQMHRLAGADGSIYANYGGRFPVTKADSYGAVQGCLDRLGELEQALPIIGGGMSVERGGELREEFGKDACFLVGGRLHSSTETLTDRVRAFVETVS